MAQRPKGNDPEVVVPEREASEEKAQDKKRAVADTEDKSRGKTEKAKEKWRGKVKDHWVRPASQPQYDSQGKQPNRDWLL
jgi:hypothetical protein